MAEAFYSAHLRRYFKHVKDPGLQEKFKVAIRTVLADPRSGKPKTGDLSGLYTAQFTFRGTSYRLAYVSDEDQDSVSFIFAGTRENFYDDLKRYMDS